MANRWYLLLCAALVACGNRNEDGAPHPSHPPQGKGDTSGSTTSIGPQISLFPSAFVERGGLFEWSSAKLRVSTAKAGAIWLAGASNEGASLQTTRVLRGERELAAHGGRFTHEAAGHLVRRWEGVAAEKLEAILSGPAGSVEHSWTFESKPAGTGDLEIHLRVGGAFRVGADGAHLTSGVRYSNATWLDADAKRSPVAMVARGDELVLSVSESVLEQSRFPAVLDPTISADVAVDPTLTPVGPAALHQSSAQTVFDGTSFITVWFDYRSTTPAIFGTRVKDSASADPVAVDAGKPDLDLVTDKSGVRLALVPPGSGIGGVARPTSLQLVHSVGSGNLVTWIDNSNTSKPVLTGVRMSDDLTTIKDATPLAILSNVGRYSVATDGASFVVLAEQKKSSTLSDIVAVRVAGIASSDAPTSFVVAADLPTRSNPKVAFDGANFLGTYTQRSPGADGGTKDELFFARFSATSLIVGGEGKRVHASMPSPASPAPDGDGTIAEFTSALAFNGTHFLALVQSGHYAAGFGPVWTVDKTTAIRILPDGTAVGAPAQLGGTGFMVRALRADGTAFVADAGTEGQPASCIQKIDANGAIQGACAGLPTYYTFAQDLAVGANNYFVPHEPYSVTARSGDIWGILAKKTAPTTQIPFFVTLSTNGGYLSSIAYDATTDKYFVVWVDDRFGAKTAAQGGGVALFGSFIKDGVASAAVQLTELSPSGQAGPVSIVRQRVIFDGKKFFLVWGEHSSDFGAVNLWKVRARTISPADAQPTPLAPILELSSRSYIEDDAVSVASDGDNRLIVWNQPQTGARVGIIVGARVRIADDAVLDATPFVVSDDSAMDRKSPVIAFNGTDYLVAWTGQTTLLPHIFGTFVGKGKAEPRGAERPLYTGLITQDWAQVASDGKDFLVVFSDVGGANESRDVTGVIVKGDPAVVSSDTTQKIAIAGNAWSEDFPSVAYANDRQSYLVAWVDRRSQQDLDIYGSFVSRDGRVLDSSGFAISAAPRNDENYPALVASKTATLGVAYQAFDATSTTMTERIRVRTIVSGILSGQACATANDCASRFCVDGVCCDSACNSGCGVCNGSAPGTCEAKAAKTTCGSGSFVCDGVSEVCPAECAADAECAPGRTCTKDTGASLGLCTLAGGRCIDDVTALAADGVTVSGCGGYKCGVVGDGAACLDACKSVDECAPGFVCDFNGTCVGSPTPPGDASGCNASAGFGRSWSVVFAAFLAFSATRRRRSRVS